MVAKVQEQALRCLRSAIAKPLHFATAAMANLEAMSLAKLRFWFMTFCSL